MAKEKMQIYCFTDNQCTHPADPGKIALECCALAEDGFELARIKVSDIAEARQRLGVDNESEFDKVYKEHCGTFFIEWFDDYKNNRAIQMAVNKRVEREIQAARKAKIAEDERIFKEREEKEKKAAEAKAKAEKEADEKKAAEAKKVTEQKKAEEMKKPEEKKPVQLAPEAVKPLGVPAGEPMGVPVGKPPSAKLEVANGKHPPLNMLERAALEMAKLRKEQQLVELRKSEANKAFNEEIKDYQERIDEITIQVNGNEAAQMDLFNDTKRGGE